MAEADIDTAVCHVEKGDIAMRGVGGILPRVALKTRVWDLNDIDAV